VSDTPNPKHPLDSISISDRDRAAEERDRQADGRDAVAQARDDLVVDEAGEGSIERGLAATERSAGARDRAAAARDRESARHDLAYAGIDDLTGAMGRSVGLAAVRREMDRAERTGEQLVLAFVDAVGLKAINDTRGHRAGDRVLEDIATGLKQDLRSYDLVARIGGDEFLCTHLGQSTDQVHLRYGVVSRHLAAESAGAKMTVGLATLRAGDSLDELVDRADQAMLADRRS
jgi:diguanylate cyclase (GGDEF)-like protein